MAGQITFVPGDHEGHQVYGSETAHYAGTLLIGSRVNPNEPGTWFLGRNESDSEAMSWELEGCYTCNVEFKTSEFGTTGEEVT